MPAGTFASAVSVPSGVTLRGLSRTACILGGQVNLAGGAIIESLSIVRTANDASDLIGVYCAVNDPGIVRNCAITCAQSGAGGAYAAQIAGSGRMVVEYSNLYAISTSGAEYDLHHATGATGYFSARWCVLLGTPTN